MKQRTVQMPERGYSQHVADMRSQNPGARDWGRCNKRSGHDNARKQQDGKVYCGVNRLLLCPKK